ncbi:hypothetical protein AXG93_4284s1250 [Marchantia polymorpha subsp. ruderalis]|uniref:Fe2OG dioxygenase domain-containing protein n=1 Tax=Marchantia polymorpha subsp. ruderalis TaxID=1480154 RepID=A0A176VTT5_MARPO|nr:hypothetical protein AXG93_4284s1250 [Marchantia polymorpha subsp. ruderalis]
MNVRASISLVHSISSQAPTNNGTTSFKQVAWGKSGASALYRHSRASIAVISRSNLPHIDPLSKLRGKISKMKLSAGESQTKICADHREARAEVIADKHADTKVPVFDISGLEGAERKLISQQIADTSETWGIFQIVNHGIDPCLMQAAKDVSKEFFYLPDEEKMKIKVVGIEGWNHSKLAGFSGEGKLYKPGTVEHLYLVQSPDTQEHLERYPRNPPAYRTTILEYAKKLKVLHEKLITVLSEMLGLKPDALTLAITTPVGNVTMRTNFYAFNADGKGSPGVCHAHTDPGGLTILLADDVPGLEVNKDGRWVPVNPIPGAFIVNIGDVLEILSNGRYKSVEHRGLPSQTEERLTMASFYGGSHEVIIGPLPELLDEKHPPRYRTCSFGDYIADFVKAGLDGKNGLERMKL